MYLIFGSDGHESFGGLGDLKHTCNTVDKIKEYIVPLFYKWESVDIGWCDNNSITSLLNIWTHCFYHSTRLMRECEIANNERPLSALTNKQLEIASELESWIAEYDIQHIEYRCPVCDAIKQMDDRVENIQTNKYVKPRAVCKACALSLQAKGIQCK